MEQGFAAAVDRGRAVAAPACRRVERDADLRLAPRKREADIANGLRIGPDDDVEERMWVGEPLAVPALVLVERGNENGR